MTIAPAPRPSESEALIREIRSRIAARRTVVVVGSGVSIGATGGPGKAPAVSWTGLLRDGVERVIALKRAPSPIWPSIQSQILDAAGSGEASLKDLLGVAEQVSECLGYPDDGIWGQWLRACFATLEPADKAVLSALMALGVPMATTNYDGLLEATTGQQVVTWQDGPRILRVLQGEEHGILHLHGYWDRPESVVLGIRAYEEVFRDKLAQFLQQMLAAGRSLIFVGCGEGLADPNFARLRGWLGATLKSTQHVHFRLCLASEVEELSRAHLPEEHIVPVAYGAKHDDLAPFLRSLVTVSAPRPLSLPTPSPPRLPARGLFVGRETEKAALVAAILDETRPIAVIGPPGIGKSALTRQALHDGSVTARFSERRWFVRLDTAKDERALWAAILLALGITTLGPDPAAQALALLREEKGLLVLDNLEAPWEADTRPVEGAIALLADIGSLRIVASIRGVTWPSGIDWLEPSPLKPLPPDQARELFLRLAGGGLAQDPDLDAIVAALDGLPLAIELIARQAQGSGRLAGLFADFRARKAALFEVGEGKDLSLRASLALSLASPKMTGAGKRLFTLMGRLPAGAAIDDLNRLLAGEGRAAGRVLQQLGLAFDDEAGRLRMLAPIREHAATRPIGDVGSLVRHYLGLADTLGSRIGKAGGAEAVVRLSPEMANLEAAVDLAIGSRAVRQALAAQAGFARLMQVTGLGSPNVFSLLADAARRAGDALGEARCMQILGDIGRIRSRHDEARGYIDKALRLFTQVSNAKGEVAFCFWSLGDIANARSQHDDAGQHFETALRLFREVGYVSGKARCIRSLGTVAMARSRYDEARGYFDTALSLYRQVGDVQGEADCNLGLGMIASARSKHDQARGYLDAALRLFRQIGDVLSEANCIWSHGEIARECSQHDQAALHYRAALAFYKQVGNIWGQAACALGLAQLAGAVGLTDTEPQLREAIRLFEQTNGLEGRGKALLELARIATATTDRRRLLLEALDSHMRFGNPRWIGETHRQLARLTEPSERAEHLRQARGAWVGIGRSDLIAQLDVEFGAG